MKFVWINSIDVTKAIKINEKTTDEIIITCGVREADIGNQIHGIQKNHKRPDYIMLSQTDLRDLLNYSKVESYLIRYLSILSSNLKEQDDS